MRQRQLLAGLLLVLVMLALVGCGGGGSGKSLAQEAIAALEADDDAKLATIGQRFDELPPVQKVRFATEVAKHGQEIQALVGEMVGSSLGQ
jgi:hypothetical protein